MTNRDHLNRSIQTSNLPQKHLATIAPIDQTDKLKKSNVSLKSQIEMETIKKIENIPSDLISKSWKTEDSTIPKDIIEFR